MRYTIRSVGLLGPWLAAAAALAVLASCEVTAPLPDGAQPFAPLANYPLWWSMVESCSNKTRPMSDIDWYLVPGESFKSGEASATGMYTSLSHRIVIAERSLRDGSAVRHEMLHAVLQAGEGELGHPAEYFLRRCAAVVACRLQCVETSGPIVRPPAGAAVRSPSVLEVTLEIDSVVFKSKYPLLGYVPVTMRARNPLDVGVVVALGLVNDHGVTFDINLTLPRDVKSWQRVFEAETYDPMSAYFASGETKTRVFDLYLPVTGIGYGAWGITGGFGGTLVTTPKTFRYAP